MNDESVFDYIKFLITENARIKQTLFLIHNENMSILEVLKTMNNSKDAQNEIARYIKKMDDLTRSVLETKADDNK